jgi:hypothetical protein
MDRTPYFSVTTGRRNVEQALAERGLMGAWRSIVDDPNNPQQLGTDRKLTWKLGDWTATTARYMRQQQSPAREITLFALVLTATGSEQMQTWHENALKTLSKVAIKDVSEFDQTSQKLMNG